MNDHPTPTDEGIPTAGPPESNTDRDIRVLCVDDESDVVELTATLLERESDRITAIPVTAPTDAIDVLETESVDCVVSDYQMPDMDGLAFLDRVRATHADLPFVLFTGKGSEKIASEAISEGVTEYLQKGTGTDQYTVLANRIERTVEESRAKAALEESERMLSTLISNLPGMVYRCRNDRDWSMLFVSEGCRDLIGYDPGTLETGVVSYGQDVIHPADRQQVWDEVQENVGAGEQFDLTYRIHTRNGEVRWVSEQGRGVYEDGELVALEGFITDVTELRDHERELREREEALRRERDLVDRIVQTSPVGIGVLSPSGELRRTNDRAAEILGVPKGDAEDYRIGDLPVYDERGERIPGEETPFAQVLETGTPVRDRTVQVDRFDGERRWLSVHAAPLTDEDGDLEAVVVVAEDVTDQKEHELELERVTELYEATLSNIRDAVFITDHEGQFTYVCPNVSHIFGYDQEAVAELGTADALLGGHLFDAAELERAGKLRNIETTVTDREGNEHVVLVTVKRVDIGEGTVLYSVREITDRKERERRFEAIFNQTFQFIGLLDPDGAVLEVNDTALRFGGVDREDVIGVPAWETEWWQIGRTAPMRLKDAIERASAGEFVRFDVEVQGDERTAIIDFSIRPITDEDDEVVLLVTEGRDITEHKRQERELKRQNERLEEFASVVSHDLRNPLTVAQGSLELARESGAPEDFDRVESAHERMNALIDDLLTVARKGQRVEQTRPVALDTLVESTWISVPSDSATLEVTFDDYRIEADEARLRQLLENLLSNAVKHGGDDVTVRVGLLEADEGFYVADDGPGVPPDQREEIFDHGFSTSREGTGFGLYIVKGIAEAHGWTVAATESEDGGVRFEVTVDRSNQPSTQGDHTPPWM